MKLSELNKTKLAIFILLYAVCIGLAAPVLMKISGLSIGEHAPILVGVFVGITLPSLVRKFESRLM